MEERKYNTDYAYVIPATGARQCGCTRCRCRGLTGPALIITLGVLFLLSEFHVARFHNTWPILLIVIGLMKVLGSKADMGGHIDVNVPLAPPPPAPPAPPTAGPGVGNV